MSNVEKTVTVGDKLLRDLDKLSANLNEVFHRASNCLATISYQSVPAGISGKTALCDDMPQEHLPCLFAEARDRISCMENTVELLKELLDRVPL